ncbi:MAG: hypothetical protein ACREXX_14405 [Gammaproteobacteria bacterium]
MYTLSDSGVERSEGARLRIFWQTTRQGLRCRWVPGETPADTTYRRAAVNAHERNRRWRLALAGRVAA